MNAQKTLPTLMASGLLFSVAGGLYGTVLSLQLLSMGQSAAMVGIVMSGYFGGQVLALFVLPQIISRFGFVVIYLGFLLLLSSCVLLTPYIHNFMVLTAVRVLMGVSMSGLYLVSESWINAEVKNENRGRIFGFYTVIIYGALGGGQLLLTFWKGDGTQMLWGAASLYLLATLPFALSFKQLKSHGRDQYKAKLFSFTWKGVGSLICLVGGITFGSFYTSAPVFAQKIGMNMAEIGVFVGIAIGVGAVIQFPLGVLSDLIGRRQTLSFCLLGLMASSLSVYLIDVQSFYQLCLLSVIVGALMTGLYPVAVSIVNDDLTSSERISVSASLLLLFTLGGTMGSFFSGWMIDLYGHYSLFSFLALNAGLSFLIIQILQFVKPAQEKSVKVCTSSISQD